MSDSPVAILHDTSGNEKGTAGNPVKVDPTGTTTQPVSATALPLPTGAATAAKQPAIGTAGTPSADVLSIQGVSGGQPIPISGSVTATPGVIPNATDVTGTISALNGTVQTAIQGYASCAVVLSGTWVGACVFEFSHDGGTTWSGGAMIIPPATVTPIPDITTFLSTNGGAECIGMGPTTHVRMRAAAYASGTINVRFVFAASPPPVLATMSAIRQSVSPSIYNNSTANLAAGASFTGTAESRMGVSGVFVNVICDQPILVMFRQSMDGTNWDITDEQLFTNDQGDGRNFQATATYFSVVATNLGPATSTYLRLQTVLCPVVAVLPRALTPAGRLSIASMTESWAPDPKNFLDRTSRHSILMDVDRNLNVRARCLTDEFSFRDEFVGSTIYHDCTGTFYFTNGSNVVVGVGTEFKTDLDIQNVLKLSSHADTAYAGVDEVVNDTFLYLSEPYTGATGSGTGRASKWMPSIGTGGSITVGSSKVNLISGTTSGADTQIIRTGDYPPYVIGFKASISQRIANQSGHVGISDDVYGSANSQIFVVWDGTDNTKCKLRTSYSSTDVEETTVTLPDGALSSTEHYYQLEITSQKVVLYINDVAVAEHRLHIPGPYDSMYCYAAIRNTGTPASTTTVTLDTYLLTNFDRVEVSSSIKGDALSVKEQRPSSPVVTSVSAAVADTQLLAPNPKRLACAIFNNSIATLYVKLGSGASASSFTVALGRYEYWEPPVNPTCRINGYWSAATGAALVTEVL